MSRILILSSQVAFGYVGSTMMTPVLQALGHYAITLPTIWLSHHRGYPSAWGQINPVENLNAGLDALLADKLLSNVDAVVTGYLPSQLHVAFATKVAQVVRENNPGSLFLCDPILGDEPDGLYIDEEAARALRADLLPLADIATPNQFELAWLTERPVQSLSDAHKAAQALNAPTALVTSVGHHRSEQIINLLLADGTLTLTEVKKRADQPNGTGDLFAALFLGHLLNGKPKQDALSRATAGVEIALNQKLTPRDIDLSPNLTSIVSAADDGKGTD